ncbi:uncharacterized protein LACBIDRAFT_331024 [Laccaria bicolor S238N-H82]|uniref:Predicted protein n=1 Tax=Laccaria bicolor (strain S238N-H82 / ATCC MYA-4686) TaxID=486041 RepID=B0DMZ2_LACBS|nr:uncharacterized protein LACBIDRAFT_331024 [Laccaria bicolor S238N-H82]EDR04059.1 predicted protein [Laccaria bicolor S238N-H82]|eukprot:XP_001885314.1 predicted protein [Laccaria bicolor S238N-H82]
MERISLVNSLFDENGLNLCGKDLFLVFSTPNTFLFLTELSFSGTRIHDFDLIHIHHLPKLSILFLNNTGIGNKPVYLLIPLKRTLTQLTLATNPNIDSTSVPTILLLSKLCYLSITDPSIDMNRLRTLAKRVDEEGIPVIQVEFWWIPVDSGGMKFSMESDHSGIYTGMVPGMVFPGMGRNSIPQNFIYFQWITNNACLANTAHQTRSLSSSTTATMLVAAANATPSPSPIATTTHVTRLSPMATTTTNIDHATLQQQRGDATS